MDAYVLDADALINLHRHFRKRMRNLLGMIVQQRLMVPEGVYREICRIDDALKDVLEKWEKANRQFVVKINKTPNLSAEWQRIDQCYGEQIKIGKQGYPGFWSSCSGRKAADAQVVAAAKVLQATVVSDDRAVQMACMLENVQCIGWAEFARVAGLAQLTLFSG
ncbi:MAG: hypothetical protein KatS3mg022_3678 [Armatimonadota bacterium]|nr:MAG: hypothetical protein KatS3mg022_3678 [Armatimonadota bacterium]